MKRVLVLVCVLAVAVEGLGRPILAFLKEDAPEPNTDLLRSLGELLAPLL